MHSVYRVACTGKPTLPRCPVRKNTAAGDPSGGQSVGAMKQAAVNRQIAARLFQSGHSSQRPQRPTTTSRRAPVASRRLGPEPSDRMRGRPPAIEAGTRGAGSQVEAAVAQVHHTRGHVPDLREQRIRRLLPGPAARAHNFTPCRTATRVRGHLCIGGHLTPRTIIALERRRGARVARGLCPRRVRPLVRLGHNAVPGYCQVEMVAGRVGR